MSMKKVLVVTALTAGLLAVLPVVAQPGEGGPGGPRGGRHASRGGPEGHFDVRHLMRLGRQLEITEEQRTALREAFDGERAENAPIVRELVANRKDVAELTRNGGFTANEAEVIELIDRQGDLLASLALSRERIKASFFELLTEEQVANLEELRSNAPRRGGRRGSPRGPEPGL